MGETDVLHLVYAIVFDFLCFLIKSNEIIVLVIPGKAPGRYMIKLPFMLLLQFLLHSPFQIVERHLSIFAYRLMDRIDILVNSVIIRFRPVNNIHLTLQLFAVLPACQPSKLSDELPGFLFRYKLG